MNAFIHSIVLQMKLSMARPMFQFVVWVSPLFYATITYFIYGNQSPEKIFQYVVLGAGFMGLWTSIVYSSASDINRERMYGTLENIFVAPASFAVILMGKIVGNTIWGFISMVLAFFYLHFVFQIELPTTNGLLVALALFAVIIAVSVFAFVMALLFTLSKQAEGLMNFIEYPIFLICGFLFPITILPVWLQPISYILPPTSAIELLRVATSGQASFAQSIESFVQVGIVTLLYCVIGLLSYKAVDRKARIDGKLGVY
ncbi:ABC transporter permease [Solibacillus silvestris]|uniref:ABC transporter permease n=1 Tax=Solibacillus silvestris TaxID=76853 RepID=UPI003F7F4266